jgi:DNA polymerase III delta prime subunit
MVSFNPIAASYMSKFMQNVCAKEGASVDKSLIDSVALGCGGDIRCAINTLQFKLTKGPGKTTKE